MKIRRHSNFYNFIGDKENGITFRWGKEFDDDPLFAPWPELADISISNHCTKDCNYCYRDSHENHSFMSVEDYEYVLRCLNHSSWGNVFQVALGGGEPLEHPDFLEIIEITNEFGVVPNFTTNGIHLNRNITKSIKGKVGAVAISISNIDEIMTTNLEVLLESDVKTNIHFILSRRSIKQAIRILKGEYNNILSGLNAIIFLTYKSTGRANPSDYLNWDTNLKEFVTLIDHNSCETRIGFDACFVPILLHLTKTNINFVDPCECAYFSVYIDENLNVKPCSFTNNEKDSYNMREYSFSEIWENKFVGYREAFKNRCKRDCNNKNACRGSCLYFEEINLCHSFVEESPLTI